MKPSFARFKFVTLAAACILVAGRAACARPILTPAGTTPMPGIEGRFDHFAYDAQTGRLFVSALENHTVEVIDLAKRRHIHTITGINEPQGLLVVPGMHQLLVCSRGDGTCRSFDTRTYKEGSWIDLGRNTDNLRFDPGTRSVYVGLGGEPGPGGMSAIDLAALLPVEQGGKPIPPRSPADLLRSPSRRRQNDPRAGVALGSHPESHQLDPAHHRLFVNVPDEHYIAVIDTAGGQLKITARWPVKVSKRNFPMAFNPAASRLYVVCRNPPLLLTYDTNSGKMISQVPCVGDGDDLYYEAATHRLYQIGGGGAVDVFTTAPVRGEVRLLERVTTAPRARTGCYIPALHLLAVAAPHTQGHAAKLLFYRVSPYDTAGRSS